MKLNKIINTSTGLVISASLASAAVESDNYDSYTDGSTIPNQRQADAPSTQHDLFTAAAGMGYGGSQGVSVDTTLVESNYFHQLPSGTGVAGVVYQVSARFQMTIDDTAPANANHAVFGVMVSTEPEWWNGSNFGVRIVRRGGGTTLAFNGIGSAAGPQGWQLSPGVPNSAVGLPDTLPAASTTATSDWFTLSLSILDTGATDAASRPLWDVTAKILTDSGDVVLSHTVPDRVITTSFNDPAGDDPNTMAPYPAIFAPGDTIYGGVQIPWVGANDYLVLDQGHLDGLLFDDLTLHGGAGNDDSDGDGVDNATEITQGTDPFDVTDYVGKPVGAAESFNGAPAGNLVNPPWSQSFQQGGQTDQVNLFQVVSGVGHNGSNGIQVDAATVKSAYQARYKATPASGEVYQVSAKFQVTIDENTPTDGNHGIASVLFSPAPDWWQGPTYGLTLIRRTGGTTWGFTGIGDFYDENDPANDKPDNWRVMQQNPNALLGLPNTLPAAGTTATSDWFTLQMTMAFTGVYDGNGFPLWDVTGSVISDSGSVIASHTIENRPITDNNANPGDAGATPHFYELDDLYAAVQIPWEISGATTVLAAGGVSAMAIDDFKAFGYSESVDIDGDMLSQAQEAILGTSDILADTDGDSFGDKAELDAMPPTDPTDPTDYAGSPKVATDDFESHGTGAPPSTAFWSTKWDGNNPSQRNLWDVLATNGVGGTQGFGLDVATAWRGYNSVNKTSVTGDTARVSAEFQFSTTGAPLDESGTSGLDGTNDSLLGVRLDAGSEWWNGPGFEFTLCRTSDDTIGFITGGTLDATTLDNSAIGLSPGTTPSTSGWFTMMIEATESGTPGTFEAVCSVSYNGSTIFTSDPVALDPAINPTGGVYGGVSVGWNNDPSNDTAAAIDPGDTAPATPVGALGKITGLNVDNYSIIGLTSTVNIDGDGLNSVEEFDLGTSDLLADTDGDTFNDDVEVAAGTDPLDANDFPVVATDPPSIGSAQMVDADTIEVQFTGNPGTAYILTNAPDLDSTFVDTGLAPVTGSGTFTYDLPTPVAAQGFFRVEEQ